MELITVLNLLKNKPFQSANEIAFKLVRSWNEKSGEFESFRLLINNDLIIDELKKVES